MKAIYTLLICVALTACAGGECDPAAVVSPQADSATRTPTVIGTADTACRDAAGNDVVCK
jgi:hypothetical protein